MDFEDDLLPDLMSGPLPAAEAMSADVNMDMGPLPPPLPIYNIQPPIGIPVSTPASVPQAYPPTQLARPQNGRNPNASNQQGPVLLFRVQMALSCGVKSEEYWGLATLLAFSTSRIFDLLKTRPDLLKLVTAFVGREWSVAVAERRNYEGLVVRQKLLEALLIVRNMCLDPQLAKLLAPGCESFVVKGITLPTSRHDLAEVRLLCLEICEHTCFHFTSPELSISEPSPLMTALVKLVESPDKSVVVAAVRSVARLSLCDGRDASPLLAHPATLKRVARLLLIDDAELLSALLDFLVQLTSRLQRVEQLDVAGTALAPTSMNKQPTANSHPGAQHLVAHLVRLIAFRMDPRPLPYPRLPRRTQLPVPTSPPELPPHILTELLAMSEPERATMWICSSYDSDPDGEVLQVSLWSNYQKVFEPHERDGTGRRLLKAIDFIRACTSNVRGAQAKVVSPESGPKKFIIKGLVPREKAVAPSQLFAEAQQNSGVPGMNGSGLSDSRGRPPPPYTDAVVRILQNIGSLQGGSELLRPYILHCVENALINPQAFEELGPVMDVLQV